MWQHSQSTNVVTAIAIDEFEIFKIENLHDLGSNVYYIQMPNSAASLHQQNWFQPQQQPQVQVQQQQHQVNKYNPWVVTHIVLGFKLF
jgi:hypothetical protein